MRPIRDLNALPRLTEHPRHGQSNCLAHQVIKGDLEWANAVVHDKLKGVSP